MYNCIKQIVAQLRLFEVKNIKLLHKCININYPYT